MVSLPPGPDRATVAPQPWIIARVTIGLNWVRQRQRVLTRAVLALFVLAWLQAAALPCVMAHAGPSDAAPPGHDCPYCPPADGAHHGCGDQGTCSYPHEPQVDARVAAGMFLAVPASFVLPFVDSAAPNLPVPDAARTEPIPRVPISVSYCRYIE
jgi:hypothetical protein